MELSAPAIVAVILAAIAFIAWLVRLEGKSTTAVEKADKLAIDVYAHTENTKIHHNADDLDRRFSELKEDITEIKTNIREGLEKIGNRIDRLFTK